jgi:hypothetical protein
MVLCSTLVIDTTAFTDFLLEFLVRYIFTQLWNGNPPTTHRFEID